MTKNYPVTPGLARLLHPEDIEYLETHGVISPNTNLGPKAQRLYNNWLEEQKYAEHTSPQQENLESSYELPAILTSREQQKNLLEYLRKEGLVCGGLETIAYQNEDGSFQRDNVGYALTSKTTEIILSKCSYAPLRVEGNKLKAVKINPVEGTQLEKLLDLYTSKESTESRQKEASEPAFGVITTVQDEDYIEEEIVLSTNQKGESYTQKTLDDGRLAIINDETGEGVIYEENILAKPSQELMPQSSYQKSRTMKAEFSVGETVYEENYKSAVSSIQRDFNFENFIKKEGENSIVQKGRDYVVQHQGTRKPLSVIKKKQDTFCR